MKSETIKKINTFGKVGYIICKIGKIAMTIAAIACLVSAIFMCFVPKDAVKIDLTTSNTAVVTLDDELNFSKLFDLDTADGVLNIGENTFKVMMNDTDEPEYITSTLYISNVKWMFFAGIFGCLVLYVAIYFAEKLCKSFKDCETPFTEEISGGLMKLAYSLIGVGVVGMLAESVATSFLMGEFLVEIELDLVTVLLILCVFMLSFIFKHGTALQAESYETL